MSVAPLQLRPARSEDFQKIREIQAKHPAHFPGAFPSPVGGRPDPPFTEEQEVFCAFETDGRLVGFAPLIPNLVKNGPGSLLNIIWADIKIDPSCSDPQEVRRCLLSCIEAHARTLKLSHLERRTQLVFQQLPSEEENLAFLLNHGFVHIESIYQLSRDLSQPAPALPPPPGMDVRPWSMQSQVEQRSYVEAYNTAYTDAPLTLQDWQLFMQSPLWVNRTCLAAFDQNELAGSILLMWEGASEPENKNQTGLTENVFVLPRWRGLGLGDHLISQGLLLLKKHGLKEAQAQVRESNSVALGLYTGLGYTVARELWLLAATL